MSPTPRESTPTTKDRPDTGHPATDQVTDANPITDTDQATDTNQATGVLLSKLGSVRLFLFICLFRLRIAEGGVICLLLSVFVSRLLLSKWAGKR